MPYALVFFLFRLTPNAAKRPVRVASEEASQCSQGRPQSFPAESSKSILEKLFVYLECPHLSEIGVPRKF